MAAAAIAEAGPAAEAAKQAANAAAASEHRTSNARVASVLHRPHFFWGGPWGGGGRGGGLPAERRPCPLRGMCSVQKSQRPPWHASDAQKPFPSVGAVLHGQTTQCSSDPLTALLLQQHWRSAGRLTDHSACCAVLTGSFDMLNFQLQSPLASLLPCFRSGYSTMRRPRRD